MVDLWGERLQKEMDGSGTQHGKRDPMKTWLVLLSLVALTLIGSFAAVSRAKPPGSVQIVSITQATSSTLGGGSILAAASDGTIYAAANTGLPTLQPFQRAGQVPGTPVTITSEITFGAYVYVGLANGDVYRGNANDPLPWTFTLQRNVFGP